MSALLRDGDRVIRTLKSMSIEHLSAVMSIERASHIRPWTPGNFTDSLASGYLAEVLFDANDVLVGYWVAVAGVDEIHLLNLSVAPDHRQCGHASFMLRALIAHCRTEGVDQLWLEVRVGNEGARHLYRQHGMQEAGLRPAYYPALPGRADQRGEDAVLMRLQFEPAP